MSGPILHRTTRAHRSRTSSLRRHTGRSPARWIETLSSTTTVKIELLDSDTGVAAPDDILDLDPIDNDLDIVLSVDLVNGTWTGDVPSNTGFSVGDKDTEHSGIFEGGERARIWFDVSVGSDGDIDDDGIPDGVERFGIRNSSGAVTTDMAALGADPCRKTIAIEIDWLNVPGDHSHQPSNVGVIAEATAMMNNACRWRPRRPARTRGSHPAERREPRRRRGPEHRHDAGPGRQQFRHRATRRAAGDQLRSGPGAYFFYNVWSHEHDGSGSSGVCCSSRKGFIVSLGAWTGQNGTVRDQSGTFVHELGHNINLGHGGGDGVNFKPNYLSVMNYRYQVTGVPNWDTWAAAGFAGNQMIASSTIDYSRADLPDIDETNLNEVAGISDGNAAAFWTDPTLTLRGSDAVNSDSTGTGSNNGLAPFQNGVAQDLNGDSGCVSAGMNGVLDTAVAGDDVIIAGVISTGPDRTCNTGRVGDDSQDRGVGFVQPNVLTGFDDWANVKFRAAMSPDAGGSAINEPNELTFQRSEVLKQQMMDAVNQPPVADAGGPYDVDEGSSVQLDGTGSSDPDGYMLTYSWSPATHLDDPTSSTPVYSGVDDTVDAMLTVTDPGALSDTDTTTVTVHNVNPTVTATGDTIDEGGTADVSATFTDPGVLDTHTATIDWGDGTAAQAVTVVQGAGSGSLAASHPYGDNGIYTVTVTVTDDDGGVDTDANHRDGWQPRSRRGARHHEQGHVPRRRRLRRADQRRTGLRRHGNGRRVGRPDVRLELRHVDDALQRRCCARPVPEPAWHVPVRRSRRRQRDVHRSRRGDDRSDGHRRRRRHGRRGT